MIWSQYVHYQCHSRRWNQNWSVWDIFFKWLKLCKGDEKMSYEKIQFEREIIDVRYVVLTFKDNIFRSDFLRSFMQFQRHNITSDKWSDQNNERFYHVKQTVENRRPSKMGDVATLLFVHFNFIIEFQNMFLFLKSIHIAY